MRTVKHKLKPLSVGVGVATEQKTKFLEVVYAYQFEKNYFSDQLLNRYHSNENANTNEDVGIDEDEVINIQSNYIQIRDKLVKNNYQSKYNLPARLWKMALKEAYDLHIRTHESQIALIKRNLNNNIYQYCNFELTKQGKANSQNQDTSEPSELSNFKICQSFEAFLYFATNSLFYNFKTFSRLEAEFFSKKFKKARIYQRAKTILLDLLKRKAVKQEVLTKEEAKQLQQLLERSHSHSRSHISDLSSNESNDSNGPNMLSLCNRLFEHYCHGLVNAIQKFRSFKLIQSQINPTITLDGDCYDLYSKYDNEAKKNRWFLDIMSLESGKRIKGLELTGFHHAKQIMKHRKAANLTLSFDPDDNCIYVHFTFPVKPTKNSQRKQKHKNKNKTQKACVSNKVKLETLTTVGGDFGLTECFTFSDGWVAGKTQRDILKKIADNTKKDIGRIQLNSRKNYFGLEKNNPTNKRNHTKNCFNHNSELKNINTNYRKRQKRYNSYLENYKHQIVSEIIHHFTTDNEFGNFGNYGNYASYKAYAIENTDLTLVTLVTLVFEDLTYTNLGRTKDDNRQINLIKGVLTLLEEKIDRYNLLIKIKYVNPAYTSQTCPNCYYVDRKNRNSQYGKFRCQHCGFTANDDERYKELTGVILRKHLPSEDDFIAACNIEKRLSVLQNSMKLRQRKIKELLMEMHKQVKGSCKMFACEH